MIHHMGTSDFIFMLQSVQWTLLLSIIAFSGGGIGGAIIALVRVSGDRTSRYLTSGYIRFFQGTPLLMQLFLVFFGAPIIGFQIDALAAASLGLILNTAAFLGEIWWSCIETVPTGQWEAAEALGLRYPVKMRMVILPQAIKIGIPPTVGFLVQLIKSTSLASIIGFTELTRAGQIVNNSTFQPYLIFSIVGLLYFALCWPISILGARLERRSATPTSRVSVQGAQQLLAGPTI
jgi:polar amino acid transport system permease protein